MSESKTKLRRVGNNDCGYLNCHGRELCICFIFVLATLHILVLKSYLKMTAQRLIQKTLKTRLRNVCALWLCNQ